MSVEEKKDLYFITDDGVEYYRCDPKKPVYLTSGRTWDVTEAWNAFIHLSSKENQYLFFSTQDAVENYIRGNSKYAFLLSTNKIDE